MKRIGSASVIVLLATAGLPAMPTLAQDIADIDYEHLSFRGIAPEWGYIWPNRMREAQSYGVRVDMGYMGPGLRVTPSVTYWRSRFQQSEVDEFSERVADLVEAQNPGSPRPVIDLGRIEYRDIALGLDAHVVWEVPFDLLTFGGVGVAAHIVDGRGVAISGTFVEDLLDSVGPGFNLHFGAEYPLTERMRLYTVGRYEVMPDLQYVQVKVGWQFMFAPNAPGEGRNDR